MSFTVAAVVRTGSHAVSPAWLTALRERFPQITTVQLLDDSPAARTLARRRQRSPELPAGETLTGEELRRSDLLDAVDYVWFLTPDSRPDPDCLTRLHTRLGVAESLAAVGPKLMSDGELIAVGVTTTPAGHRCSPVSPGEKDAGQHDRREDVLAVDEPGMLVKADVVRALGVPADELSVAYRGIEYCDRLRRAGHRIEVVPQAVLSVEPTGIARYFSSPRPLPHRHTPRHEHRYQLARTPRGRSGLTQFHLAVLAVLRALGALLSNAAEEAGWWFAAAAALPRDAVATRRLRRFRSSQSLPRAAYATAADLRAARRELAGIGDDETAATHEREEAALNTAGDLAEFSGIDTSTRRSLLLHPLTAVLVASAAAGVLMFHRLIGPGAVTGGAWARLDVPFSAVLARIFSPLLDLGLGSHAPADPLLSILAVLSLPALGSLDLALRILWLLALPLAALIMYLCAGRIVPAAGLRALLALIWIAQPAFLVSLHEGRIGIVLAWLAAPAVLFAFDRAVRHRSVSAAAAAGLAAAVLMAGTPFLIVPLILIVCTAMIILRTTRLVWVLIPGLGLSWPWLVAALRQPDALMTDPGRVLDYAEPRSFQLALGWAVRPQLGVLDSWLPAAAVPWLLAALLLPLLAAVVLAAVRIRSSLGLLGLSVACYTGGLAGAIIQASFEAQLSPDGLVASFTGDSMLLIGLGFCGFTAAALWPQSYDRASRARSLLLRLLIPTGALLMLTAFSLQALIGGTAVHRTTAAPLPAFAAERYAGPLGQRTLILTSAEDQLYGQLVTPESNTVLSTSTMHEARSISGHPFDRRPVLIDEADVALARTIGRLTAGSGDDARTALDELGVGFVVVRGSGAGELAQTVSVSPGMTRLGDTDQGILFQVVTAGEPIASTSIVGPEGRTAPVEVTEDRAHIPAGSGERTLVLAERPGLTRVLIDGRPAERAQPRTGVPAWQAAYQLPETAATVTLHHDRPRYAVGVGIGWLLFALAVVVAIPFGARTRQQTGDSR